MSFVEYETSVDEGKPVALYEFKRGAKRWTYNSSDRNIVYGGLTYEGLSVSDDGITQSGQAAVDDFKVKLPTRAGIVALYRGSAPSDTIYLTVRHLHYFPDSPIAPVQWVGVVQQARQTSAVEAEITCQTLGATLQREGLRQGWDRMCPHTLYDHRCKVDKTAFVVTVTAITGLTGISITAPEFATKPDRYFDAGFIEWDIGDGAVERRPVELHLDDTITLLAFTDGLAIGDDLRIYPGCLRTISECDTKFDNHLNYGGFPHLPGDSPFDGNPVY